MAPYRVIGLDTEGWKNQPWGGSLAITDSEGYVFRADDPGALAGVQAGIDKADLIILHNIFHDLEVLRAMGVSLPVDTCIDTMIMAYLLVVEPQGLKSLGYRFAGMGQMLSYDEVMAEASEKVARDYLLRLWQVMPDWLKYRPSKQKKSVSRRKPRGQV